MSIVHTYCFKFSAVAIEISCRIIVEWLRVRNINPVACCPNRWHRFRTSPTLQIPRKGAGGWGTLSCSQGHFPVVLSCQPCSGGDEVVGLSVRPVRTGSSRNFCLPRLQNWEKTVYNPFKSSFLEPVFFPIINLGQNGVLPDYCVFKFTLAKLFEMVECPELELFDWAEYPGGSFLFLAVSQGCCMHRLGTDLLDWGHPGRGGVA